MLHKIPKFHLISWCGNFAEMHSFCRVSGKSCETLQKPIFSKKSSPGNWLKFWYNVNNKPNCSISIWTQPRSHNHSWFERAGCLPNSLLSTLLGDSWNYMPSILVPYSAKRIATHILVIAKLNERKYLVLRCCVYDMMLPSKQLSV